MVKKYYIARVINNNYIVGDDVRRQSSKQTATPLPRSLCREYNNDRDTAENAVTF